MGSDAYSTHVWPLLSTNSNRLSVMLALGLAPLMLKMA